MGQTEGFELRLPHREGYWKFLCRVGHRELREKQARCRWMGGPGVGRQ